MRLASVLALSLVCSAGVAQDRPGSLSRESIRSTIRSGIDAVRACYEHELTATPALRGRVVVQFIIAHDGSVIEAHPLENALAPAGEAANRTASCIVEVVRGLRFEHPDGDGVVGVNYPFVLDSTDEVDAGVPPPGWHPLPSE